MNAKHRMSHFYHLDYFFRGEKSTLPISDKNQVSNRGRFNVIYISIDA